MISTLPAAFAAALNRHWIWLASAISALAFSGCQTPSSPSAGSAADLAETFYSTNVLHQGDVVQISFQYATNFDVTQKIALDGTLNLNPVGPIKAAGKTELQLQAELTQAYQALAKGDVITVNRMISSSPFVYVSGAVLKPGEVELDRPLTAIEAIMAVGGFDTGRASLSDVSVLRMENGRQHAYHVNLKRVLAGKEMAPFYVRPYDIIYVPAKTFNY
jgi:polysaccharide export outer membrane protein